MRQHDRCGKRQRVTSVVICSSPLDDPQSQPFWMLGKSLAQSGHRVTLVTDNSRHDLAGIWEGCDVRVWPSETPGALRDLVFFRRLVQDVQPHAVISSFQSNNIAMPVGRLFNVPCRIAWYRNLSSQIPLDFRPHFLKKKLQEKLKGALYRLATHVVPVSAAGKRDLIVVYGVSPDRCKAVFHTCRPIHVESSVTQSRGRTEKSNRLSTWVVFTRVKVSIRFSTLCANSWIAIQLGQSS
jgi:hypothetical protein